jgi:hypothetical protein
MEEIQKNLKEAVRHLQIADHMTYVTFPLVNEYRLLLKIFDEIHLSIIYCVNAILNYEYHYKRIRIYSSYEENLDTFIRIAKNYGLNHEQTKRIKEIIELNKKHKKSAMEFVRKERIVILSDNLGTQTMDLQVIKQYLLLAKELLKEVSKRVR